MMGVALNHISAGRPSAEFYVRYSFTQFYSPEQRAVLFCHTARILSTVAESYSGNGGIYGFNLLLFNSVKKDFVKRVTFTSM